MTHIYGVVYSLISRRFLPGVFRFVFPVIHLSSFASRDGQESRSLFLFLVAKFTFRRGFFFGQDFRRRASYEDFDGV